MKIGIVKRQTLTTTKEKNKRMQETEKDSKNERENAKTAINTNLGCSANYINFEYIPGDMELQSWIKQSKLQAMFQRAKRTIKIQISKKKKTNFFEEGCRSYSRWKTDSGDGQICRILGRYLWKRQEEKKNGMDRQSAQTTYNKFQQCGRK